MKDVKEEIVELILKAHKSESIHEHARLIDEARALRIEHELQDYDLYRWFLDYGHLYWTYEVTPCTSLRLYDEQRAWEKLKDRARYEAEFKEELRFKI